MRPSLACICMVILKQIQDENADEYYFIDDVDSIDDRLFGR
jgi:hypothetical protein